MLVYDWGSLLYTESLKCNVVNLDIENESGSMQHLWIAQRFVRL